MKIYAKINQVMKDCGAVGKDSYNPQQKYKYRGIDAIMNALNPAMTKNGVFVVPEVLEISREERQSKNGGVLIFSTVKVRYTFFADDGSSVQSVVIGEGMDSGDKSVNKAMSAAFKYACFQVFCIPTDEMVDSETESPEVKGTSSKDQDVKTKKIDGVKITALKEVLADAGIDEAFLLGSCKVKSFEDITEAKHLWILANIATLKAGCDKWKAKGD